MNRIFQSRQTEGNFFRRGIFILLVSTFLCATKLFAALQFDVFLGYDGIVPQASWIPVTCELKNDGPTFTGIIEVSPGSYAGGQPRRMVIELPTGSLKRVTIPVFSPAQARLSWDVRLLTARGKVVDEKLDVRPRRTLASETRLVGSVARTTGGAPAMREVTSRQDELKPGSARLIPSLVPDNPIVLEGLDSFYLNSERATELSDAQVRALVAWLYAGGNLIVGVEQISDINASPWLRNIFPCDLNDVRTIGRHPELQAWLRESDGGAEAYPFDDLTDDFNFENAPLQVAVGKLRDGREIVKSEGAPLVVSAERGRGHITALLTSTEREPLRSWKNLPAFWTKLVEVPPKLYSKADNNYYRGSSSADGIFGAMIDSKQVRKLPVHWLLLLLVVYLVVIGPLDHYWLKRIGRPMLTWITFPCYVVFFSFMIYFIGYKLRSGETEWNELHLVDVLANGDNAELRGRTFASIYSPVNEKYRVESKQPFATFRGEFSGSWQGGKETEKATVFQRGDNFTAEIFVPVWTSQLFVSDWWQSGALPLRVTITPVGQGWQVKVENRLDKKIQQARFVVGDQIFDLGGFSSKETKVLTFNPNSGQPLQGFLSQHGQNFQGVVQSRQQTFGSTSRGQIADAPNAAMTASFLGKMSGGNQEKFISPPGLDLSPALDHGGAVVLAWVADYTPTQPINQFSVRRSNRDTLLRVTVPVNAVKAL